MFFFLLKKAFFKLSCRFSRLAQGRLGKSDCFVQGSQVFCAERRFLLARSLADFLLLCDSRGEERGDASRSDAAGEREIFGF